MVALAFHLYHGAWSIFQSLGINNPRYNTARRGFAILFAGAILLGNVGIVVAINSGVVNQDDRCWPTPEQFEALEVAVGRPLTDDEMQAAIDQGNCPFQGVYLTGTDPTAATDGGETQGADATTPTTAEAVTP
jgi:hypothetical protein